MDDNKKFGDVSQEDIDKAKKAAPDDLKEKQPVNVMDEVFEWAESFVFAMFVVILIFTFFFRIVLVQGPSMRETLQDQDRLIITHINYTPQKGDIVVINSEKLGKTIIKRVIGTGGDKVVVDYNNNTVTVNGMTISGKLCITLISLMRNMKWKKMFLSMTCLRASCSLWVITEIIPQTAEG